MIKVYDKYDFPNNIVVVAKSINEPLNKATRFLPGLAFIAGGVFLLLMQLNMYSTGIYEDFSFSQIILPLILVICGLFAFIALNSINKYKTIGKAGNNAISYNPNNNSLLIRRWEKTYEFKIEDVIDVMVSNCLGSNERYEYRRYVPSENRHDYYKDTQHRNIRKITFTVKGKIIKQKISVPVYDGENVYLNIKENLKRLVNNN